MKRWLTILFVSLALIAGYTAFHSQKANAAEATTISASIEAAPSIKVIPEQRNIAGGVIKPFWTLSHCFLAMDGYRWCVRNNCTAFEYWAMGCRNGQWYKVPRVWYA